MTFSSFTKSTLGKVFVVRLPTIELPSEKYGSAVRSAAKATPVILPANSRGLRSASRLFRADIVALLRVALHAKAPFGLIGEIFRGEIVELLDEKEMRSSIAQSGTRFLAASRWWRGMKRSVRQFKFVITLPRSVGEVKTAFPL